MISVKLKSRKSLAAVAGAVFLMFDADRLAAGVLISNLGDMWPGQYPQEIGDIEALSSGELDVHFLTGAGSFSMNAITLEFFGTPAEQALANIQVLLFQQVGNQNVPVGSLAEATINPGRTQWPKSVYPTAYTTYIDFHPATGISLQSDAQYWVGVSARTLQPSLDVGLLFTQSSIFTTPTDWQMGSTTGNDPYAKGEFLKFAVDATPAPEPSPTSLVLLGAIAFAIGEWHKRLYRKRGRKGVGSEWHLDKP